MRFIVAIQSPNTPPARVDARPPTIPSRHCEGKGQCGPAALGWADAPRRPLHRRGRLCHTSTRQAVGWRASTVPASKPSCEGGRAASKGTNR